MEAGPSKLSGRRSGLTCESPIGAGQVGPHVTPAGGLLAPQELAARLERHQVSGRISINAPFTFVCRMDRVTLRLLAAKFRRSTPVAVSDRT